MPNPPDDIVDVLENEILEEENAIRKLKVELAKLESSRVSIESEVDEARKILHDATDRLSIVKHRGYAHVSWINKSESIIKDKRKQIDGIKRKRSKSFFLTNRKNCDISCS